MPYSNETDRHKRTLIGGSAAGAGGVGGASSGRVELPPGAGGLDGALRSGTGDEPYTALQDEPHVPGTQQPVPPDRQPVPGAQSTDIQAEHEERTGLGPPGGEQAPNDPSAGGAGAETPPDPTRRR